MLEHRVGDLVTATHLGHDAQVALEVEQRRQGAAHQRLVVGEQQPDDAHRTLTVSSNPCGASVRVTSTAPAAEARSRSPSSP